MVWLWPCDASRIVSSRDEVKGGKVAGRKETGWDKR